MLCGSKVTQVRHPAGSGLSRQRGGRRARRPRGGLEEPKKRGKAHGVSRQSTTAERITGRRAQGWSGKRATGHDMDAKPGMRMELARERSEEKKKAGAAQPRSPQTTNAIGLPPRHTSAAASTKTSLAKGRKPCDGHVLPLDLCRRGSRRRRVNPSPRSRGLRLPLWSETSKRQGEICSRPRGSATHTHAR